MNKHVVFAGMRQASEKLLGKENYVELIELTDGHSGIYRYAIVIRLPDVSIGRRTFKRFQLEIMLDKSQIRFIRVSQPHARYSGGDDYIHPHIRTSDLNMCSDRSGIKRNILNGHYLAALQEAVEIVSTHSPGNAHRWPTGCLICYKADCDRDGLSKCRASDGNRYICVSYACNSHRRTCQACSNYHCDSHLKEKTIKKANYRLCLRCYTAAFWCGDGHFSAARKERCPGCKKEFCSLHLKACALKRSRYCKSCSRCTSKTLWEWVSYEALSKGKTRVNAKLCAYADECHDGKAISIHRFLPDKRTKDNYRKVCTDCVNRGKLTSKMPGISAIIGAVSELLEVK